MLHPVKDYWFAMIALATVIIGFEPGGWDVLIPRLVGLFN
jgi:hypothetical protein